MIVNEIRTQDGLIFQAVACSGPGIVVGRIAFRVLSPAGTWLWGFVNDSEVDQLSDMIVEAAREARRNRDRED